MQRQKFYLEHASEYAREFADDFPEYRHPAQEAGGEQGKQDEDVRSDVFSAVPIHDENQEAAAAEVVAKPVEKNRLPFLGAMFTPMLDVFYEKPFEAGKALVYAKTGEEVAAGETINFGMTGVFVNRQLVITKNHFEKLTRFAFKETPEIPLPPMCKILRVGEKFFIDGREIQPIVMPEKSRAPVPNAKALVPSVSDLDFPKGVFLFDIKERDTLFVDSMTGEPVADQSKVEKSGNYHVCENRRVVVLKGFLAKKFVFRDSEKLLTPNERKRICAINGSLHVDGKEVLPAGKTKKYGEALQAVFERDRFFPSYIANPSSSPSSQQEDQQARRSARQTRL